MRTLAVMLLTVALTACAPGSADRPRLSTAAHGGAARAVSGSEPVATVESARTCERPRTFVKTSDRSVFIPPSWDRHRHVTVHAGEVVHLVATGDCASSVSASPQNSRLRVMWHLGSTAGGPTFFRAIRPGIVRLVTSKPMCPALPRNTTAQRCIGGVQVMGTAIVRVRPSHD